jgi:hypothetical protein
MQKLLLGYRDNNDGFGRIPWCSQHDDVEKRCGLCWRASARLTIEPCTTACVWSDVGFLTPKKMSWPGFLRPRCSKRPTDIAGANDGKFHRIPPTRPTNGDLVLPLDRTAHGRKLLLRPMSFFGYLLHRFK